MMTQSKLDDLYLKVLLVISMSDTQNLAMPDPLK